MASTFAGLNIGSLALSSFQTSVNTTANNIANAKTTGYTRQTAKLEATQAIRVNARYGSMGTGVNVTEIYQERNLFYDAKYWNNNAKVGNYDSKVYYYSQVQQYFTDDKTQTGYTTLFSKMYNNLDGLISDGVSDESVRTNFIQSAQNLCSYFNELSKELTNLQSDVNEQIKTTVKNVNAISKKLALLNKEISMVEVRGTTANELRDERANLLDELSQICEVTTTEVEVENRYGENLGNTYFTVEINGQTLVDNFDYREIECETQTYKNTQNDIDGLYKLVWSDTKMDFAIKGNTSNGILKSLFELRDGNNGSPLTGKISQYTTGMGTVTDLDGTRRETEVYKTVTLTENLSITSLSALDIPSHGKITIGNKVYEYDGWKATTDADSNITSYTFNLVEGIEVSDFPPGAIEKKTVTVGNNIECMGIPYYEEQINEFLRIFTEQFNDIEEKGLTLDGDKMCALFKANMTVGDGQYGYLDWNYDANGNRVVGEPTGVDADGNPIYDSTTDLNGNTVYTFSCDSDTYYQLTGINIAINADSLRNSRIFSTTADIVDGVDAYELLTELQTLENKVTMFRGDTADKFLETLLSDVAIDTAESETFYKTYSNLQTSIQALRQSVSGVDEDEEALSLVKYQNAYNMSSKVISVMSEMYDRLITQTGVS